MSRLIDADKLLECVEASMLNNTHRNGNAALCHVSEHRHFIEMIVEQPTAFDVEKVIEILGILRGESTHVSCPDEECEDCKYFGDCNDCDYADVHALDKAIEIVKRGGRDEDYWK